MNAISVANVAIRQFDNLYSLNDLHKASGGEKRHELTNWLKLQQTTELIDELSKPEITGLKGNQQVIKVVRGGSKRGTYACKELVYAYATWISAKFFLQVIRTFDAVISGSLHSSEALPSAQTTIDERRGLVDAVKLLVARCGIDYSAAYRMVHQRFGVARIDQIAAPLLPSAVAYVHSLMLHDGISGEVLDRLPATLPNLEPMLFHTLFCAEFIYHHDAAFRLFNRSLAAGISDHAKDAMRLIRATARHMGVNLPGRQYFDNFPWGATSEEKRQYHRLCFDI